MPSTLTVSSVLKDSSKATITDSTTYTSPTRAEQYSVFYANKVDENDVDTALAVTTQGDPNAVREWEVTTPQDGHHRFTLVLYIVWTNVAFTADDIVERNGVLYKCLITHDPGVDPEVNGGNEWAVHTGSVVDYLVDNVAYGLLNCVLFGRLKVCFATETAEAARTACVCDDDKKPSEIQRYERYGILIDGIAVDNYQARYSNGEKKVRYMSKLCPNCD
jgi:hypothetical protein